MVSSVTNDRFVAVCREKRNAHWVIELRACVVTVLHSACSGPEKKGIRYICVARADQTECPAVIRVRLSHEKVEAIRRQRQLFHVCQPRVGAHTRKSPRESIADEGRHLGGSKRS
eukprot:CAMPEP_0173062724 /NCGR_PEP_ID=MMETSP1102-20130122/3970_1 /TAXON_ID=49646 /ORGANISM="Geminigera sp., Strain Caron Lab Isolate" /LENGTH=114 /DNA_ID=CAMNT_0013929413 /DNA_START=211 /DNA_END=555 /DNA_ORIENTATION=+